ncbi:hypothetical protein [Streptomyces sp. NPDC007905]|uniref:hypothetical protein n=1 Tax=Streptomyces sp. NPDC007905 TaxID=3364788 RepID=UPI0036E57585
MPISTSASSTPSTTATPAPVFLTLVFVLAREGVTLDDVSLLRRVSFQADDPQDALTLTRHIDIHLSACFCSVVLRQ